MLAFRRVFVYVCFCTSAFECIVYVCLYVFMCECAFYTLIVFFFFLSFLLFCLSLAPQRVAAMQTVAELYEHPGVACTPRGEPQI